MGAVQKRRHTNLRLKGKKGPPARGAAPKGLGLTARERRRTVAGRLPEGGVGAASVFHKTRLSDIPRQRLHKAIHCLASAQPTNRPPQSSRKIGLREAGRLAEPLRFADANHLPFQGRQSVLNANWYQEDKGGERDDVLLG